MSELSKMQIAFKKQIHTVADEHEKLRKLARRVPLHAVGVVSCHVDISEGVILTVASDGGHVATFKHHEDILKIRDFLVELCK